MDYYSFQVKFLVTCLHIEQFVVNSRPILCLGSSYGDIAIYYLDEPVHAKGHHDSFSKGKSKKEDNLTMR